MRRLTDVIQDLPAGAEAAIDEAAGLEAIQGGLVVCEVLGLPANRCFPGKAKPGEVF